MSDVLAIDTATSRTVAALTGRAGVSASSEQRHGALLLELLQQLVDERGARSLRELSAIVVGTGPGNFTGLRIGMATAKTIAYAFNVPIVGVPTASALARAAIDASPEALPNRVAGDVRIAVLQPAGPNDRYLTIVRIDPRDRGAETVDKPRVLTPGKSLAESIGDAILVAVDLAQDSDVPAAAFERGARGLEGLGDALIALGEARLRGGRIDDVADLVPTYVTLPRGVQEAAQEIAWSPARA
jgi:tRNA threonylcarbamoyl adenosine modification protein YeaZ